MFSKMCPLPSGRAVSLVAVDLVCCRANVSSIAKYCEVVSGLPHRDPRGPGVRAVSQGSEPAPSPAARYKLQVLPI